MNEADNMIQPFNFYQTIPRQDYQINPNSIMNPYMQTVLSRDVVRTRYKDDLSLFGTDISEVNKRGADELLYICT